MKKPQVHILLFVFPFLLLAGLGILSFFQHPYGDDFAGHYFVERFGISGSIRQYLQHGTGRYFGIPVFILICSSRFLLDHYYLVLLGFMGLTYVNLYGLLSFLSGHYLTNRPAGARLHWATAFLLSGLLCIIPEVSSFFFWVTSDCIFLLSFNLFLWYLRSLLDFIEPAKGGRWQAVRMIHLAFCVCCLCGCDEVTLYYSLICGVGFAGYQYLTARPRRLPVALLGLVLLQLVCIAGVFLLPGNQARAQHFAAKQALVFSLYSGGHQMAQVCYSVFSSPMTWVLLTLAACAPAFMRPELLEKLKTRRGAPAWELAALLGSVFFFYFFIRHFGGRFLPLYVSNMMAAYLLCGLVVIVLLNSPSMEYALPLRQLLLREWRGSLLAGAILVVLVFSPLSAGLLQSLVTAPVHNEVLNRHIEEIRAARQAGRGMVTFSGYQQDCLQLMEKKYGMKTAAFVRNAFHFPPRFIYFIDDSVSVHIDYKYAEYYGIDSIRTGQDIHTRWRNSGTPFWNQP